MSTQKKILIIVPSIIALLILISFMVYQSEFAPREKTTPITTTVNINESDIIKELIPKKFDFSFKGIKAESTIDLTEKELTDMFVAAIQEEPEASKYLTGISIDIKDNLAYVYAHFNYFDIPFEAKLVFSAKTENGEGILHYESGKLGFIDIGRDTIFSGLQGNSILKFNKETRDIILNLKSISKLNIKIKSVALKDNKLNIVLEGGINFFK